MGRIADRRFVGEHPDLIYGNAYSIAEYARVANVSDETMRNRLRRHKEVSNILLFPASTATGNRLENKSEVFSQKWLRRKI